MRNSNELVELRRKKILDHLQKNHHANVSTLAAQFHVTPTTIRRDLEYFEKKGFVTRYFGGVRYSLPPDIDVQYQTPLGNPSPEKTAIAKTAAKLIQNDDILFLNSSSTALAVLDYIKDDAQLTVVTNNGRALYAERTPNITLFLTGGEVYGRKQSLVGEFANNVISMLTASKCILGVSGISVSGGITSTILQETTLNQKMISHCIGPRIVVADGSKIGVKHNFHSGKITDITHLITDSSADPIELERIRQAGVEIIIADQEEAES